MGLGFRALRWLQGFYGCLQGTLGFLHPLKWEPKIRVLYLFLLSFGFFFFGGGGGGEGGSCNRDSYVKGSRFCWEGKCP